MSHPRQPEVHGRARPDAGAETGASLAELYRLLVESVNDYAIYFLDPQGCIRSWNPGAQRLKGYEPNEIIGKHFSVFYPPEERNTGKAERELAIARDTGRFEEEDWRVRKDGSRFWANVILTPIRDAKGQLVGYAKITRDLTARREAEEQARKLAAEQAALAEAETKQHELATLNEQLQQQALELEVQTEEAQSLTEDLEQANEQLQESNTELNRALEAAEFLAEATREMASSLDYETRLRTLAESVVPKLGDWCAVDVIVDPEKREWPPRMERLAVVHQDPAKVKWAEDLAEQIPPDWTQNTGLPRVLREGVTEFYPTIGDDLLRASARSDKEYRLLKQLGFSSALVVPLKARGLTLGALTLVYSESGRHYDTADRKLAESLAQRAAVAVDNSRLYREAERARAEAEEANRAKSQFLARMSHELRTPLNAIAGYTELMEMGLHGPLTDAQHDALHRVQRSQRTLLGLIEDVLNFARLESGRLEYRFSNVSVDMVLTGVETIVSPELKEKGLEYEYCKMDPSITVWADADKMEQILLNLVINAIKFTDKGKVTIECEPEDGEVRITVVDTGIGVAPDKLAAIFEPFVQAEPALTRTTAGSGLGLAISRELARAMNGDVTVTSEPGKGSRFTLRLPRSETRAKA